MNKSIKVSCLPVAGEDNPYQLLMISGLNTDSRINAKKGIKGKFFGILKTAVFQNPDYIHFDWIESYYYRRKYLWTLISIPSFILQILFVKYVLNIRLVWTLHNLSSHENKYPRLERWCHMIFAKHSTWIRVFSEGSKSRAVKYLSVSQSSFKVFPEGSYVNYYENTIPKAQARKELSLPENHTIVLYLGLIKPYKGVRELVTSFQDLDDKDLFLVVAGKIMYPDYFKSFGNKRHPRVKIFPDFISNDQLQLFYNSADVVALPFKKIENSGSLINAMGFKKAVIAPGIGVIEERLNQQKELLYKSNIKEGLEKLKEYSIEELEEIGVKNYMELKKNDWPNFTKAFLN